MRRMRVVLGLLVALVLVLAMTVPALTAAEFTDIDGHPYEASILNIATRGFAGGYADGTFRPDDPLLRQQFAKMADLALGYEVTAADQSTFKDTPDPYDPVNDPLYPGSYAAVAAAEGIMYGYLNGNFGFTDNVTRQQAISVAVRAAGDSAGGTAGGLDRGPRLLQSIPWRQHQEGRVQRHAGRHRRSGQLGHDKECHPR